MSQTDDPKTLKKRVTISVIAQLISQVLMGLIGVFILKIMTNDLGVKSYGVYVTIFTFVSTFSLLTDFGVNTITTREIAKHPDDAASIIGHNMGLRICLALVMIPVIFGLGFIFYPQGSNELHVGILLMSLYLIFNVIWAASGGYFTAKVRNDITARITVMQQLLFLVGVFVISLLGWKLFGYITAYITAIATAAFVLFFMTRKHVAIRPRINIKIWRGVIQTSITLGIITIINSLILRVDSIILSIMSGPAAVGIYGVAFLLITVFSGLPSYIMSALLPSMATAGKEELQATVQKAFHFMVIFAFALLAGVMLVSRDVVELVSSKEFIEAAKPFTILSIGLAFSYINSVFSFTSIAINKHHKFVYRSLFILVLSVLLNIALIPHFGIIGAASATAISQFCGMIIGYRLFRSQTGLILNYKILLRPFIAGAISITIGYMVSAYLRSSNPLLNCLLIGATIGIPYLTILYITDGFPAGIKENIKKSAHAFQIKFMQS